MATWDSYTQKSTPADADTLMIKDTSGGANKRTPFSGVWNWILTKLTNAVISQLETTNKSIIPAINELNSKSFKSVKYYHFDAPVDINYQTAGDVNIEESGLYLICFNQMYNSVRPSGIKLVDGNDTILFYDEDRTDLNFFVGFSYFNPGNFKIKCKSIETNTESKNGVSGIVMKIT